MTGLPVTISIRLAVPCTKKSIIVCSRSSVTNRVAGNWYWCVGIMCRKRKNISINASNFFCVDWQFYSIDQRNHLPIMRTFLDYSKDETLNEIETPLENVWQLMKDPVIWFLQHSLLLILKRKRLPAADRIRCGESGTPSTNFFSRWSNRRCRLRCHAPMN